MILKINAVFNQGEIALENGEVLKWRQLSSEKFPVLPSGCKMELAITIDRDVFLSGMEGNVWATYDLRQAEIIQSALFAQSISAEVKILNFSQKPLFLIKIVDATLINEAIDFIWRGKTGLKLEPDWDYPENEINKSFEKWLGGD